LGSAKGILYLHTEANPPIFHRDIKASNILLDDDKTAKVADFGLSKLAPVPDLQGSIPDHISTVVKGTPGYIDPEYFLTHKLTDKSDVYSFGVVLLELFSGQHPIAHGKNIVREVIAADNAGKVLSFVDPRMGSYNGDALQALFRLGMACCRDRTDDRPSMVDVVRELENIWRSSPYSMPRTSSVSFTYSPSTSDSAPYTGQDASSMTSLDIEKSNVTELLSHTVALVRPR
jgi:serine/threonine protein kinase